ncbi:putative sodium-coupled neutral amino acid transporter 11 [Tubulanus polymorphus]|uniref:putative sodium-coupled neutral amino acid transporter 11 n=1 Tax=Tubulanus polymorphus TaxID=672921 RepID=UPI003DA53290
MEMSESTHILEGNQTPGDTPATTPDISSDTYQLVNGDDMKDKDTSSMPMASFNFINSIIGSGIIGAPYALKQAGFGLGLILIVLVAFLTDYSISLLIYGGSLSNTNSYQDMMRAAFGRPGFYILTFIQALYPFIAMISYNVIIGDTITKVITRLGGEHLAHTVLGNRQFVIALTTVLVTLPLSLYRNVSKLSKASLVSVVFILFIVFVIIGKAFVIGPHVPSTEGAWSFANTGVTQSIGILAFAFMCHHNSFLIYDSLEMKTEERFGIVTHASVIFAMVCTLILGVTGYATFTGFSQGDLLENYCRNDDLMNAIRIIFALTIMLTYPIECFVVREVVENSLFVNNTQPAPLKRHVIITLIVVTLTVVVSMATDCLSIVLQLNGVLAAAPLAYIIPPLCVMRLQQDAIFSLKNVPCIVVCVFGILVMVCGFAMTVVDLVDGITCSHGKEMAYCLDANTNASVILDSLNRTGATYGAS